MPFNPKNKFSVNFDLSMNYLTDSLKLNGVPVPLQLAAICLPSDYFKPMKFVHPSLLIIDSK